MEDRISLPSGLVTRGGSFYYRDKFGDEFWDYMHRLEEPFNHILDIVFASVPGDVVADIFEPFTDAGDGHLYQSLGDQLRGRYGWGLYANVTNPDSFFVSGDSILAVELKFNAKTSIDQLAKYIGILLQEELHSGKRKHIDLLYILNNQPAESFRQQTGIAHDSIQSDHYELLVNSVKNQKIQSLLQANDSHCKDLLERLGVNCISWQEFHDRLSEFRKSLGDDRGERTISNLIEGLMSEIVAHPLSNVEE